MKILKQFNITADTHIIYEARYQPYDSVPCDIYKMHLYIVYDKDTKKIWLIEVIDNYPSGGEHSYVLKTLHDISILTLHDIRVEYNKIAYSNLYQNSYHIFGNIEYVFKTPIMKQHQRSLKIKKILQRKRRV